VSPLSTSDKINLLSAIGVWFTGLATLGAVGVALYFSSKPFWLKLKFDITHSTRDSGDKTDVKCLVLSITNTGGRRIELTKAVLENKNAYRALQTYHQANFNSMPHWLDIGERATFLLSMDSVSHWESEVASSLIDNGSAIKDLDKLKLRIYESTGQSVAQDLNPTVKKKLTSLGRVILSAGASNTQKAS
jgi:hypothetical protein